MSHDRLALARNRINWLLVRCKIKCEWTQVAQSRIIWFSYATVIRRRVVLWRTLDDFWATVCRTVRPMLSGRCLSVCPVCPVCVPVCLSVTLEYCGQTVGRIKMNLAVQVGLRPGHIVLHGVPAVDPAPPHNGAGAPPPIFGPCLLWPNGWMDDDATQYRSRPLPRPHRVRRGPICALVKGNNILLFSVRVYCGHGRPSQMLLSCCSSHVNECDVTKCCANSELSL